MRAVYIYTGYIRKTTKFKDEKNIAVLRADREKNIPSLIWSLNSQQLPAMWAPHTSYIRTNSCELTVTRYGWIITSFDTVFDREAVLSHANKGDLNKTYRYHTSYENATTVSGKLRRTLERRCQSQASRLQCFRDPWSKKKVESIHDSLFI